MDVNKACKRLMIREPFYGLFSSTLNKLYTKRISTLAVGLQGVNVNLYINLDFWNKLTDEEQLAVLKHELMHICFFHITMSKAFSDKKLFNYAGDLEINQYIEGLPKGCIDLKFFEEKGIILPPKAGTKEYYKLLKDAGFDPNEHGCDCQGDEEGGDEEGDNGGGEDGNDGNGNGICPKCGASRGSHETWKEFEELSDAEKKIVENQINNSIKHTAETIRKSQGHIPNEMVNHVDELFKIKKQVFNWKAYFRRLLGSSAEVYTKKSLRKLSKRFEDSAGIKVKKKAKVLVGIDTSGSVSLPELEDFFSEIHHIYKAGTAIKVIDCDAAIQRIYDYKGKFDGTYAGGGGTDFAPVVEYYNQHRSEYSVLVYFTDGYASITNFKAKQQMIWLISSNGDQNKKYPGITIKIPKNNDN